MQNDKVITIIRGVSGSGKSTFARLLDHDESATIICADDHMTNGDGEYEFDPAKLTSAHKQCFNDAKDACQARVSHIIVANTNTAYWQFRPYLKLAEEFGYSTFVVTMEKYHTSDNIHDVPADILEQQKEQIIKSLQLTK